MSSSIELVNMKLVIIFAYSGYLYYVITSYSIHYTKLYDATGVPGTAIIKSADQSGMMVNNMPQVDFDFEVTLPGKDAYSLKTSLVVPMTQLAAVAAGNTVGVLVDPANPESLMSDWSRPQG